MRTRTVMVKAHPRVIAAKTPDPFQDLIDARRAKKVAEIEQFRSKRPWWREALQNLKAAARGAM